VVVRHYHIVARLLPPVKTLREKFGEIFSMPKQRTVAINDDLLREAECRLGTPTHATTIRVSVQKFLPAVVADLVRAGLRCRPPAKPRPRGIDDATWQALDDAGVIVPLGQAELLRCCLERSIDMVES
jgi:hypothetical protein